MKYHSLLWLILAILSLSACKEQAPETLEKGFLVVGTTDSLLNNAHISIMIDGKDEPIETIHIKDSKFWYNGHSDTLKIFMAYRSLAKSDPAQIMFFAQNGDTVHVHISPELGMSRVSGTTVNDDFQMINDSAMSLNQRLVKVFDKYGDKVSEAELQKIVKEEKDRLTNLIYKVAEKHVKDEFGYFIITQPFDFTDEQRMALIQKMPIAFRNRPLIKDVETAITSTGKKFPDYSIRDVNGSTVSLMDEIRRHQVTVIYFWASNISQCIQEMPHLVQLYELYKDKGLGMIGVSLDKDEESWKKAVSDFNANWPQVSELNGWDCKLVNDLGVTAIPHTIIVDSEGTIVAQGLTGLKLEEYLRYLGMGQ